MTPQLILDAVLDASLVDWLDILLLAYVFYRVLVVIQGTRAMQSALGLMLLGVLYLVSDLLRLTTVHWVLDNLFVYIILAVLILFQEDIRRALARAGGTVFQRSTRQEAGSANVLEEVIRTCFALAHRKIGALIVIERQGSLDSYLEGGQRMDAVVSQELLQAIFHPTSPLHDGAVVVVDNRIAAASVFLPISLSKEVSRAWGTRHRAAIGITERTDGLALVVSEERGTVALVARGEITPVADSNDLRQLLVEQLDAPEEEADPKPAEATGAS